jgi:hypothetical protein
VERNAGRDGAKDRPDGCPDASCRAAEVPVQLQWDACRWAQSAWDASDGARPDANFPDAADRHRELEAADAGRLADRAPDGRARDVLCPLPEPRLVPPERLASRELCRRVAVRFEAQSCVAAEAQMDAKQSVLTARPKLKLQASSTQRKQTALPALRDAPAEPQLRV